MTPNPLTDLVAQFAALPSIGQKTAMRLASHLLQHNRPLALSLSQSLARAVSQVHQCRACNTLTPLETCEICVDAARDDSLLCVVENPVDIAAMEAALSYQGQYFVLMGQLSPLDGLGPHSLALKQLQTRVALGVREVILATSSTAAGDATAHMVAQALSSFVGAGVKLTRLARGVPMGVELDYVDLPSLAASLRARKQWAE